MAKAGAKAAAAPAPAAPAPTPAPASGAPAAGATGTATAAAAVSTPLGTGDLATLQAQLIALVEKQKRLADEVNQTLNDPVHGLRESTRKSMKNLDVAVVQSKQPGYFHYYQAPPEVKQIETSGFLKAKIADIHRVEQQIEQVRAAIAQKKAGLGATGTLPPVSGGSGVNTLPQWFATYQRPDPVMFEPVRSTVVPSPKVYGGSKHYGGTSVGARSTPMHCS